MGTSSSTVPGKRDGVTGNSYALGLKIVNVGYLLSFRGKHRVSQLMDHTKSRSFDNNAAISLPFTSQTHMRTRNQYKS